MSQGNRRNGNDGSWTMLLRSNVFEIFRKIMYERLPCRRFRDTPSVGFFDVTVDGSNARDLVIHTGPAVSPPNDSRTGAWQFYLHPHQEDNLLAASGGRTFYLVNMSWQQRFHVVRLDCGGDILRIPAGTFHRSISDQEGSVVLNQAKRHSEISLSHEFRVYNSAQIPALAASIPLQFRNDFNPSSQPILQAA